MKTIGEIKEAFSATQEADWNAICQTYETDPRSGVQKLVQQYRKKLDALEKEKLRMEQMMQFEHKYEHLGYLCGIDEVGRGPLAGPVVACAVILPKDHHILYLNDSKKLTAHKREELDYVKASGLLFDDFRGGKIGRVTLEWAEQEKSE